TPKIITINENKTTKNALIILKEAGLTRKKQKLKKDQLAAQLILQSYLDFDY
ncbi:MAG: pre-16S rRNA-processing nuclease YqgF, partial [Mycoplasma sp.]|nr:pre-16S rRNA-processing nuclease YqgF [Mycoplasma sp.]